jgi:phospholipid transport system transporter-binding protein
LSGPGPAHQARLEALGLGAFALSGELDHTNAAQLLLQGERDFAGLPTVAIDLAGVTQADSAGLALLIEWVAVCRGAGRDLRFRSVPSQLIAIARLAGVEEILPIER